jgi:hypothetical protein
LATTAATRKSGGGGPAIVVHVAAHAASTQIGQRRPYEAIDRRSFLSARPTTHLPATQVVGLSRGATTTGPICRTRSSFVRHEVLSAERMRRRRGRGSNGTTAVAHRHYKRWFSNKNGFDTFFLFHWLKKYNMQLSRNDHQ